MPGVQVREMDEPSACCGSAGIYNITHPEMSNTRLERKLRNIQAAGAPVVVTNGPGCLMQLRSGVKQHGMNVRVRHISQVVEENMDGREP